MKIGIDARWVTRESSGIGHYTLNLIRYLSREVSDTHRYFIFYNDQDIVKDIENVVLPEARKLFVFVFVSYSVFSLKSQVVLPFKLRQLKIDLFHSPNFMIPLFAFRTRLMVTIHDLIPFLFPQYAPRSKKSRFYWVYRMLMIGIVSKVDFIWVDSQYSGQDMITHFPNARRKIGVLTFGADPSFKKLESSNTPEVLRKRLKISGLVILYVGRRDPYKNILGLINIFEEVLRQNENVFLVLAGPEDPRYPEIRLRIAELGLEERIVITGYLSQTELVDLYHLSSVLALPSFYEGFGLPILEAFHCGVPVVASNVASIPELVGDAGILLDPKHPELWPPEILRVLSDPDLRTQLIQKGTLRLNQFSWEKAAQGLIQKYKELAS